MLPHQAAKLLYGKESHHLNNMEIYKWQKIFIKYTFKILLVLEMYKEINNVNIKISNNLRFHVTPVRIAKTIKQMIAYVGEIMGKGKHLLII